MGITYITGSAQSGKSYVANALRNKALNYRVDGTDESSSLLIDENQNGDLKGLLEKIIRGDQLQFGQTVDEINWKANPQIIVVGEFGAARLEEIERLLPGFKAKFGPVYNVSTGNG